MPKSSLPRPCVTLSVHPAPAARGGFATILILMLVFLMMMLVLIYLRTMRAYTVGHPDLVANADPVCAQIEGDLASIIGSDGAIGGTGAYEPYDYPWTCSRMNAPCQLVYPQMAASAQGLGDPRVDDSWLAPTEPVTLSGGYEGWTQVSNIAGSFLAYDNANLSGISAHPATGLFVPQDVPAGLTIKGMAGAAASGGAPTSPASTSLCAQFQEVALTDPRLVDADGDGVPDSLWFYPRNSLQGNIRYVAAVRVVDLSSMVNLDTALGESQFTLPEGSLPDGSGKLPRKGEGPYEIDASPLVGAMPDNAKTFRQTIGAAPGIFTAVSPLDSWRLWLAGGAMTAADGTPNTNVNVNTLSSPLTRQGRRYDLNDEIQLRDLSDRLSTGAQTPVPAPVLGDHYPALNLSVVKPPRPAVTSFASLAADLQTRGRVSTLGGACDAVAGVPVKGGGTANLGSAGAVRPCDANACQAAEGRKFINGGLDNTFAAGNAAGVCSDLFGGVDPANQAANYPYPQAFADAYDTGTLKFTKGLMTGQTLATAAIQYQTQWGACLADALDNDSMNTGAWSWSGHEPAPILNEVYVQTPYWGTAAPVLNGDGTYTETYGNNTAVGRPAGGRVGSYAFELANPYPIPVRLDNLRFRMGTFNMTLGGSYPYGFYSSMLDTYVATAESSVSGSTGLTKDAAGKWVLNPGECVIFYRNGVDQTSTYAFGGSAKADLAAAGILPAPSATVHLVDLGTANNGTIPLDLNGTNITWKNLCFQIEQSQQYYNDNTLHALTPVARVILPLLTTGTTSAAWSWTVPNVPSGRQSAVNQIVYAQADARTFGSRNADGTPNLNLLQVRPTVHNGNAEFLPDLGDFEVRVNFLSTNGAASNNNLPYPSTYTYTGTHLNYETANMVAFGQPTKVAFPGPNPTVAAPATRQDLNQVGAFKNLFFDYTGIPSDTTYKGTFPDLTVASSPLTQRNNPTGSGGGASRASGTPRTMELMDIPILGPIYSGNTSYRGPDSSINFKDANNIYWRDTLGDAYNYFLTKDAQNLGLRGLCLRRDVPFFDPSRHPDLPFNASKTDYAVGDEAQFGNEIYQVQIASNPMPQPDPATNVGPGLAWKFSNGPYARANQFWRISWAEAVISRLGLDSPKYKGKTASNADGWKPGTINLNTAPKEVLKCLSLPAGADAGKVADRIIACRQAPAAGQGVVGAGTDRKGLAFATEAFGRLAPIAGSGQAVQAGEPDATDLWTTLPAGKTNFDILSWLPQQASCRSDVFCAYILVQGYKADDFNKGPIDVRRKIVIYSRKTDGTAAAVLASKQVAGK